VTMWDKGRAVIWCIRSIVHAPTRQVLHKRLANSNIYLGWSKQMSSCPVHVHGHVSDLYK